MYVKVTKVGKVKIMSGCVTVYDSIAIKSNQKSFNRTLTKCKANTV